MKKETKYLKKAKNKGTMNPLGKFIVSPMKILLASLTLQVCFMLIICKNLMQIADKYLQTTNQITGHISL